MATRNYAFMAYGMVLDDEAECAIRQQRPSIETLDDLADRDLCEAYYSFDGETFPIDDDGEVVYFDAKYYNDEPIFYISIMKYPSLCKRAYESVDEIIDEIKKHMRNLLPADFDIRSRLRFIAGTYYG